MRKAAKVLRLYVRLSYLSGFNLLLRFIYVCEWQNCHSKRNRGVDYWSTPFDISEKRIMLRKVPSNSSKS